MRSHTGSLPPWPPSAAHVLVARQVYVVCLKVYTCERLFDAQEWSQFVHTDSSTAGFVLDFHAGRKLDFALGPSLSASASTVALNAPSEKRSPASPSPDIVDPDGYVAMWLCGYVAMRQTVRACLGVSEGGGQQSFFFFSSFPLSPLFASFPSRPGLWILLDRAEIVLLRAAVHVHRIQGRAVGAELGRWSRMRVRV